MRDPVSVDPTVRLHRLLQFQLAAAEQAEANGRAAEAYHCLAKARWLTLEIERLGRGVQEANTTRR